MSNSEKLKVLFLHNTMSHYRVPIWNLLAEKCDLTIAYTEGKGLPADVERGCKFKTLFVPAWKFLRRVVIYKRNVAKLAAQFDVVLGTGNITWLGVVALPWLPWRKFRFVFWSLGVSASYDKGYDECKRWDWLRKLLYNKADACIFYTDYPVKKYKAMGIAAGKMFVAPNTVAVAKDIPAAGTVKKDSLLFIGSLYPQKGVGELLSAYKQVLDEKIPLPPLNILGGGTEMENLRRAIKENALSEHVFLRGPIYDAQEKAAYFARAFACISPKQAGLAVQESLGYGVPFITHKNAKTGGEIFDVKDGKTGRLLSDTFSLCDALREIASATEKYAAMGKNAREYYLRCRKPEDMASGAWQAIQYVARERRR